MNGITSLYTRKGEENEDKWWDGCDSDLESWDITLTDGLEDLEEDEYNDDEYDY